MEVLALKTQLDTILQLPLHPTARLVLTLLVPLDLHRLKEIHIYTDGMNFSPDPGLGQRAVPYLRYKQKWRTRSPERVPPFWAPCWLAPGY